MLEKNSFKREAGLILSVLIISAAVLFLISSPVFATEGCTDYCNDDGDERCSGDTVQVCDEYDACVWEDKWQDVKTCDDYCDTDRSACKYCSGGSDSCPDVDEEKDYNGGEVCEVYDKCRRSCSESDSDASCTSCNYNYNSCGETKVTDCDNQDGCYSGTYKDYECSDGGWCDASCSVSSTGTDSDGDGYDDQCDSYDNDPCSISSEGDNCGSSECDEAGEGTYCSNCDHCTDGTVNCGEECEGASDCYGSGGDECDGEGGEKETCEKLYEDECTSDNKLKEYYYDESKFGCSGHITSKPDVDGILLGKNVDREKNKFYVYDVDYTNCRSNCKCDCPCVDCEVASTEKNCVPGVCGAECDSDDDCAGDLECGTSESDCLCEDDAGPPSDITFSTENPSGHGTGSWINRNELGGNDLEVRVSISDTNPGSGVKAYRYRWCRSSDPDCAWSDWDTPGPTTSISPEKEGKLYLWVQAKDRTNKVSETKSGPDPYQVDTSGPCFTKITVTEPFSGKYDPDRDGYYEDWNTYVKVESRSEDPYNLSGMKEVRYLWEDSHVPSAPDETETYSPGSPVQASYLMTTSGEWDLTATAEDEAGNTEQFTRGPFYVDNEDPQLSINHNTTPSPYLSRNVTKNRVVTFRADASDEYSGIEYIEIYVQRGEQDDYSFKKRCNFGTDGGDAHATCSWTSPGPIYYPLETVKYKAKACDDVNLTGNCVENESQFTVCGFQGVPKITEDIPTGSVHYTPEANCGEGTGERGGIHREYCQDNEIAAMQIEGRGMCPPLLFVVNASSKEAVNETLSQISRNLTDEDAPWPLLQNCTVAYSGGNMSGVYGKDTENPRHVPFPDPSYMHDGWPVQNETHRLIPYECQGETVDPGYYWIYEDAEPNQGPDELPEPAELPALSTEATSLRNGSTIDGNISFDPTLTKVTFSAPEKIFLRTGDWRYVIPLNATNWNEVPIVVRLSWHPRENLFAQDWKYKFTEESPVPKDSGGFESMDLNPSEDLGGGSRYLSTDEDNTDMVLKLGGRDSDKRTEHFALMVKIPRLAVAGPYLSNITMKEVPPL